MENTTSYRRRTRFWGVDFSGARDAGRLIWVTAAEVRAGRLTVGTCVPATELTGGGAGRDSAYPSLVRCLADARHGAIGLDFPFSLPDAWLAAPTWEAFLRAFPQRFPTAERFYRTTQRAFGESRRRTDVEARAPMAVNNLRLYRQTFHGLRDILLPLVERRAACVVPQQTPRQGVPWLLEACPATALIALGMRRPYKGRGAARRKGRLKILGWLERRGGLRIPSARLRRRIVAQPGGDALDSVIAAWIAWRAVADGSSLRARDRLERREGRIYHGR